MSKKSDNKQNTAQNHGAKTLVRCLNCLHADLHRYDNDPILAACHQKPQPDNERFPFEIEVANILRLCAGWKFDASEKTVEQRTKHQIA